MMHICPVEIIAILSVTEGMKFYLIVLYYTKIIPFFKGKTIDD